MTGASQTNSNAVSDGCQTEDSETCSTACQVPEIQSTPDEAR